jgi:hypothetical protein
MKFGENGASVGLVGSGGGHLLRLLPYSPAYYHFSSFFLTSLASASIVPPAFSPLCHTCPSVPFALRWLPLALDRLLWRGFTMAAYLGTLHATGYHLVRLTHAASPFCPATTGTALFLACPPSAAGRDRYGFGSYYHGADCCLPACMPHLYLLQLLFMTYCYWAALFMYFMPFVSTS